MKNNFKIFLLVILLGIGVTSCTTESIDDIFDSEVVVTNSHNQDVDPPNDDPN